MKWTAAQLAWKPHFYDDDDPLNEIDATIARARNGDLHALNGILAPSRPPVPEPEPRPPEAPYVPAHLRYQQQQDQARYGLRSRLVRREAPLIFKATANGNLDGKDFICSMGKRDRYGDEVSQDGWELDPFKKNPVALFGHYHDWAIGTWEDIRVQGGALRARLKLAPAGLSERIDEIRGLVQHKILKATSVGFLPLESEPLKGGGLCYKKMELCEISIVTVPALDSALATE